MMSSTESKNSSSPIVVGTESKEEMDVDGLDDDSCDVQLTLISKDEKKFTIDKKTSLISNLVKTTVETDETATEVPIPGVKSDILELVLQYMNQHKGVEPPIIEKPLRSKVMADVVKDAWDAPFIDGIGESRQQLYDLILVKTHINIFIILYIFYNLVYLLYFYISCIFL